MKAYPLRNINNIQYEDVPYPECPEGWSIIQVKAAGICSSDIPRIFRKGTYHFPTIPGHEFSGIVHQVSDRDHASLVGKKVGVFPLIPCRVCDQCKQGRYEMCAHYDYIGSRRDGAFAEYVAVPLWNLIELSDETTFEEAAMMEPLAVALHAVKRLRLSPDDDLAIIGTGMIAFAAAQWAVKEGVKSVTVIGRSENKRKIADMIGGIHYLTMEHCIKEFDATLEAVGNSQTIEMAINLLKPSGKCVLMGNPDGDIKLSQDSYWRILRRQLYVTGTWNSSYEKDSPSDWSEVRDALADHSINAVALISHRYAKEQLMDALSLMQIHKEPYCKVMTIWNEE